MLRSQKLLLSLSALVAVGLAPISAHSLSITAADLTSGLMHVTVAGTDVHASGGPFGHKTVGGFDVAGITGGWEGGEIDLSAPESISFNFGAEPKIVTQLSLGALFAANEEDDVANEEALVSVVFADFTSVDFVLKVTGPTTATWSGPGGVINVSPGLFSKGGVWSLTNPFGGGAVKYFTLSPRGPNLPTTMRNNDYGFVSLSATVVPEPGTLMLMGAGLAGLARSGRRRMTA